jgi:hypothetical protein
VHRIQSPVAPTAGSGTASTVSTGSTASTGNTGSTALSDSTASEGEGDAAHIEISHLNDLHHTRSDLDSDAAEAPEARHFQLPPYMDGDDGDDVGGVGSAVLDGPLSHTGVIGGIGISARRVGQDARGDVTESRADNVYSLNDGHGPLNELGPTESGSNGWDGDSINHQGGRDHANEAGGDSITHQDGRDRLGSDHGNSDRRDLSNGDRSDSGAAVGGGGSGADATSPERRGSSVELLNDVDVASECIVCYDAKVEVRYHPCEHQVGALDLRHRVLASSMLAHCH